MQQYDIVKRAFNSLTNAMSTELCHKIASQDHKMGLNFSPSYVHTHYFLPSVWRSCMGTENAIPTFYAESQWKLQIVVISYLFGYEIIKTRHSEAELQ